MTSVKIASGFILFRRLANEINYLMLQASYGDFHWSPPKGHLETGETEQQAAFRETEEEAGIPANQMIVHETFRAVLKYQVKNKPKTVIYFLAELKNPNFNVKLSDEHQEMKWLPYAEAYEIAKYEDMRKALQEANDVVCKSS